MHEAMVVIASCNSGGKPEKKSYAAIVFSDDLSMPYRAGASSVCTYHLCHTEQVHPLYTRTFRFVPRTFIA